MATRLALWRVSCCIIAAPLQKHKETDNKLQFYINIIKGTICIYVLSSFHLVTVHDYILNIISDSK